MRVPRKLEEFMTFLTAHANLWDVNHTALGLSTSQTQAYKTAATGAQALYATQVAAQEAAKSATIKQQVATASVRTMTADLIRSIIAFADQQADPAAVYALGQIAPPSPATPIAPPGTPSDFVCTLMPTGELELSWKCPNPEGATGTVYEVKRRIGSGGVTYVGVTGERKFTDDTVPSSAAVPGVTYFITGVRSTARGVTSQFLVSFGIGGGGISTVSISQPDGDLEQTETRLAA